MTEVFVTSGEGLLQYVHAGPHEVTVDEPVEYGGTAAGPTPYDLLAAALGSCTSMTLLMYARRKGWPLEGVRVAVRHTRIHATDCAECDTRTGMLDRLELDIALDGPLDEPQRQRLLEIADKCPVHRTLKSEISIVSRLADG